jgi:NAD(P)H dehydrogenase (quinone)
MHVLVVYCHPVETSFASALHQEVLANLRAAGHTVDDCDLYAEGFDPVMSPQERLQYHEVPRNREALAGYVARLHRADARVDDHACYHLNVATEPRLARFKQRVGQAMAKFA